jgi:hypothetical protein
MSGKIDPPAAVAAASTTISEKASPLAIAGPGILYFLKLQSSVECFVI